MSKKILEIEARLNHLFYELESIQRGIFYVIYLYVIIFCFHTDAYLGLC